MSSPEFEDNIDYLGTLRGLHIMQEAGCSASEEAAFIRDRGFSCASPKTATERPASFASAKPKSRLTWKNGAPDLGQSGMETDPCATLRPRTNAPANPRQLTLARMNLSDDDELATAT